MTLIAPFAFLQLSRISWIDPVDLRFCPNMTSAVGWGPSQRTSAAARLVVLRCKGLPCFIFSSSFGVSLRSSHTIEPQIQGDPSFFIRSLALAAHGRGRTHNYCSGAIVK